MADRVTAATLNTWKGDGDYRRRVELICDKAKTLCLDILLLQESFEATALGLDTAKAVSDALGFSMAIQRARLKEREVEGVWGETGSGLAILTRGKILSDTRIALDADAEDGERISQAVEIALDGLNMLIVNTHLTYLKNADAMRRRELEQTLTALPDLSQYDLVLMGGYLNCRPDSAPIQWLLGEAPVAVEEACAATGMFFNTVERDGGRSRQIDYLFRLGNSDFRFNRVRRVFDGRDLETDILPSDHFGVWARLTRG